MVDFRPRRLSIWVVFDIESESEVQNVQFLHPKPKCYREVGNICSRGLPMYFWHLPRHIFLTFAFLHTKFLVYFLQNLIYVLYISGMFLYVLMLSYILLVFLVSTGWRRLNNIYGNDLLGGFWASCGRILAKFWGNSIRNLPGPSKNLQIQLENLKTRNNIEKIPRSIF